jgi:hypothetical protein
MTSSPQRLLTATLLGAMALALLTDTAGASPKRLVRCFNFHESGVGTVLNAITLLAPVYPVQQNARLGPGQPVSSTPLYVLKVVARQGCNKLTPQDQIIVQGVGPGPVCGPETARLKFIRTNELCQIQSIEAQ